MEQVARTNCVRNFYKLKDSRQRNKFVIKERRNSTHHHRLVLFFFCALVIAVRSEYNNVTEVPNEDEQCLLEDADSTKTLYVDFTSKIVQNGMTAIAEAEHI